MRPSKRGHIARMVRILSNKDYGMSTCNGRGQHENHEPENLLFCRYDQTTVAIRSTYVKATKNGA